MTFTYNLVAAGEGGRMDFFVRARRAFHGYFGIFTTLGLPEPSTGVSE